MQWLESVRPWRLCVAAAALAAFLSGCGGGGEGPELIDVTGTVTMDGEPLPNATVRFLPESTTSGTTTGAGGETQYIRPATGVTDDDGQYELQYSTAESGAIPGKYRVAISTYRDAEETPDGEEISGSKETVPKVYNIETTLTAEVSAEKSTFDFALKSDAGDIQEVIGGGDGEFGNEDVTE
ncbi:MAG: carboxypeptidase-like regulatory domain-containing protein [Planctomycetaceae bacterium]